MIKKLKWNGPDPENIVARQLKPQQIYAGG